MLYTRSNLQVEQRVLRGRMRKLRISARQVAMEFGTTAARTVRRGAARIGASR